MSEHTVMGTQVKDGPRAWPEWQHHFKAAKLTSRRTRISAEAGLHYIRGNSLPYFSVTGILYEFERGAWRDAGGGCIHREVLAAWPELAPVVALHLSDSDGTPMHGDGNGWYHLAGYYGGAGERYHAGNSERQHWKADGTWDRYGYPTPDECLESFARLVRVTVEEARTLAEEWQRGIPYAEARALYRFWVRDQAPRWKAEAEAVCALLDSLIAAKAATK